MVLYILFLLFSALAAWNGIRRFLHVFQLNSYKTDTQLRWMKTHPERLLCLLPALLAVPFACVNALWAQIVCTVWTALAILTLLPRKAKKPLVWTARAKRLAAANALLFLLLAVAGYFCSGALRYLLPALAPAFSPLFLLLANLLCAPIEKAIRQWYVNDAVKKLRACPDLDVFGITGSYGKTSVKSYLGQLLSAKYDTLITPESYNTPMGVVRTVRERLKATHRIFVCEMGARRVGDIKELCDLVHPRCGLITAVGNQHLETFHTPENILKTKFELADALPADGLLFLNADSEPIRAHLPSLDRPYITYGTTDDCDYYASDVSLTPNGTSFVLHAKDGGCYPFRMKLIGTHSVLNVTGALAVCLTFGISPELLAPAVRKLEAVPHRMQLLPGDITYIDDAYNSNPAGCKAALTTLSMFDCCRILVTPGMVELGDDMERCNREFGRQASEVCDEVYLVGEAQAVPIRAGLTDGGFAESKIHVVHTLQDALSAVRALKAEKPKIVLLENDLPDNY